MPATAVRVVAVPSRQEIEERFRDLYPELLSRACTIAARERDPEEVVQELLSFGVVELLQLRPQGEMVDSIPDGLGGDASCPR